MLRGYLYCLAYPSPALAIIIYHNLLEELNMH